MTVPTSDNREEYTGNDSTTVFPYAFKIFENSDLEVYLQNPDGTETLLTLDTDYTVSGAGDVTGGNVTYPISGDPLASDEKLVILRVIPVVQETDLRNQGAYYPQTLEDELDRSRMIDQQQQEEIDRSLKFPAAEDGYDADGRQIKNVADGTDPDDVLNKGQIDNKFANEVITQTAGRWDGKGKRASNFQTSNTPQNDELVNAQYLEAYVASVIAGGEGVIPETYFFDGDGSTTVFSTPGITALDPSSYTVTIDGIDQRPGTDYTVDVGTETVTFNEAPPVPFYGESNNVMIRVLAYKQAISEAQTAIVDTNYGINTIPETFNEVEEAVNQRVIRVSSRTEMKAYNAPAGTQFSLEEGGRSGIFAVKSGIPPVSDTQEGVYVVLNNGNYAERIYSGAVRTSWFGSVGDGTADDTDAIEAADAFGGKYLVENGTYRFLGQNLPNIANMVRESDSVIFKNDTYTGNIQWDRGGAIIGLHHNHLEEKAVFSGVTPKITSGNIAEPPRISKSAQSHIDLCAFWYQDFGLDAIRDSSIGSNVWYSWEWNHTDAVPTSPPNANQGYLPSRHPILGWYRGDDENVLGWQCYWLAEAGITSVVLQVRGQDTKLDTSSWQDISDVNNWIYKLLNTVPNGAALGMIPWVDSGDFGGNFGDSAALAAQEAAWDANIQAIHESRRAKLISYEGKDYLTVYMFEGNSLRGDRDNFVGSSNTRAFLKERADFAKSLGYAGIAVMARDAISPVIMDRGELLGSGVIYFEAGYLSSEATPVSSYATYDEYADNWEHTFEIPGVPGVYTEAYSSNHPSDWGQSGSTFDLFRKALSRAIGIAKADPEIPNIVTIYNVSEWAEGGASLQPTLGNGWGYLDAVRDALAATAGSEFPSIKSSSFFKPNSPLQTATPIIYIYTDFSITSSVTPFLEDGRCEGQEITVVNSDALGGGYNYILQDNSNLAGSNLYFRGGANKTISPWESVTLKWLPAKGWIEK